MDIAELVKNDIEKRIEQGVKTYGERLRINNGRDALQDAYEEALDLCLYLKQAIGEKIAKKETLEMALDYLYYHQGCISWSDGVPYPRYVKDHKRLNETIDKMEQIVGERGKQIAG